MSSSSKPAESVAMIGRYRPIVKLGTGGMADVYLAVSRTQTGIEKLAVLKRLRPDLTDEPEDIEHFKGMFWDEARLAMILNHSNVVHTHDACEDGDSLYLVMEYIEGQSLNNVQRELARRNRPLTDKQAALIMSEILAGLHYAHEVKSLTGEKLNIVHRDVSPQNILLGYDGSIKLVDFGVAKASTRSTETKAGTLKGKARYMAPEQVTGAGIDRRADIYSAGVVLWELIAKKKMVAGSNMVEQLMNVLQTEPQRLSTVVPDVDPVLEAIIHKALSRKPENRYSTAQDMREALLSFVNREGEGARTAEIGALVSEVFAKKREEVDGIIRARMALDAQRAATGSLDVISTPELLLEEGSERSLPSAASLPSNASGPGSVPRSGGGNSFTPHAVVQSMSAQAPIITHKPDGDGLKQSTPIIISALLGVCLIGGVTGGFLLRGKASPDPSSESTAQTASTPPPPGPWTALPPATSTAAGAAGATAHEENTSSPPSTAPAKTAAVVPTQPALRAAPPPPQPPPQPPPKVNPTPAPPPTPTATAPEAETGYLTLDTYPWTKVSEGGRVLGTTPLVRVPISAGTHVLTLENPDDNVRQTTTVVVKPGETVSKRLAF